MGYLEQLRKWSRLKFMNFITRFRSRDRLIKETKIEMIDHILQALCECELTELGREYLINLKNATQYPENQTPSRNRKRNR